MSFFAALFAVLMGLVATPAIAQEGGKDPSFIRIGGGLFDANDNEEAAEFHLEYISGSKWWVFNPFAGIMTTTESAFHAYAGVRLDVFIGRRIVFTPSFAPGLYHDGDGKDLGHPIEFRSALELAYRFDDRSRLGVSAYHISNAAISDKNPGTEVITMHYSYPFNRLFGDE